MKGEKRAFYEVMYNRLRMWRHRKSQAPKELSAKGLSIFGMHITVFRFIEMTALVEASQISEQGKVDYSCVITFDHL